LRIDGAAPACETAPAASLRRGDPVVAIGDPLAFAATLTTGHVSSPARPWGETSPHDVVQHDAALNPGSSGGPLVDRMGRVVAMNVAIADGARRHVGIGFALPIETVEAVAERLLRDGEIARPRLGLRLRSTEALRPAIPSVGLGLIVEAVEAGSPAARAGLVPGDVVTAIDGRPVEAPRDLARALETRHPGDDLALDLRTDTTPRRVILGLDAAPRSGGSSMRPEPTAEGLAPGFALGGDAPARIASIDPDGPAAGAGLAIGDELLSIGGRRPEGTSGPDLLARAAAEAGGAGLALLVRRGAETRWVVLGPHGRLDAEAPFGSNAEAPTSHTF
jgi:S1-C subfamily serine protease